jgi:hypothetical protein
MLFILIRSDLDGPATGLTRMPNEPYSLGTIAVKRHP